MSQAQDNVPGDRKMVEERLSEDSQEPEVDIVDIEKELARLAAEYLTNISRLAGKNGEGTTPDPEPPVYIIDEDDNTLFERCRVKIRQADEVMSHLKEDINMLETSNNVLGVARRNFERTSRDFWAPDA